MAGAIRATLAVGFFGVWLTAARGLRSRTATETGAALSDWVYFPPNAEIGIVTGGRPEDYKNQNFASKTASIMLEYAERHRYAFYVDKKLPELAARGKYWNKVILMQKLLREINTLVWIDPEMVIKKLDKPIEELLKTANCKGTEQEGWDQVLPWRVSNDTFMILNSDKSPRHYLVNANTGMVILRRKPETFDFLSEVWKIGNDPKHFEHHQIRKGNKTNKTNNKNGWPYEQGAFWDVLANSGPRYIRHTCVAKGMHFHDVRSSPFSIGAFATNMYGSLGGLIGAEAKHVLKANHITPEIH